MLRALHKKRHLQVNQTSGQSKTRTNRHLPRQPTPPTPPHDLLFRSPKPQHKIPTTCYSYPRQNSQIRTKLSRDKTQLGEQNGFHFIAVDSMGSNFSLRVLQKPLKIPVTVSNRRARSLTTSQPPWASNATRSRRPLSAIKEGTRKPGVDRIPTRDSENNERACSQKRKSIHIQITPGKRFSNRISFSSAKTTTRGH